MDWIEPGLAIGSLDDAMASPRLAEAGIRSILTLDRFPNLSHTGYIWHRVALLDGPGNAVEEIERAVRLLQHLHAEHPPLLVHCAEGKSRSALIVCLYLARRDGIHFEDAYARVQAQRSIVEMDGTLYRLGLALAGRGTLAEILSGSDQRPHYHLR